MTLHGYLRSDGRKGIRNTIVVGYLVECAHHVAREIAIPFRENDVHVIGFPGCYPNSYAEQMMERLCTHPNVGAVLLVAGLFPLSTVPWEGMTLPAPRDPEAFLEMRYGADWRRPVAANNKGEVRK